MKALREVLTGVLAFVSIGCGLLAAPSTGDVDLPTSILGPYQPLNPSQVPTGSRSFLSGNAGTFDEPNVITVNARHLVFHTIIRNGIASIGRADEQLPYGSLVFGEGQPVFSASTAWEGRNVSGPSVLVESADRWYLVYAADGGIGVAKSTDNGQTFVHPNEAGLTPVAASGELGPLTSPSLVAHPAGGYLLVYESGGTLFGARAPQPEGPWSRLPAPLVSPNTDITTDAGLFESRSLDDPALTVFTTPTGRPQYVMFFTARGPSASTFISCAASFDGMNFTRTGRLAVPDRMGEYRAGNLEIQSDRVLMLWVSAGSVDSRFLTAGVGPLLPRQLVGFAR